jgi:polar amino acid transport system substrate-binding protein
VASLPANPLEELRPRKRHKRSAADKAFGKAVRQRIEQVVVNLILNACQALPDKERAIQLSTSWDPERRQARVEVKDEGVGIPLENLPRVTEPFFTTKRNAGGTGLGLSVSAGIAREHGGSLEFESTPGQGTTARLVLPVAMEESK